MVIDNPSMPWSLVGVSDESRRSVCVEDANDVADAAAGDDQMASHLIEEARASVNRRVSHFMARKIS